MKMKYDLLLLLNTEIVPRCFKVYKQMLLFYENECKLSVDISRRRW